MILRMDAGDPLKNEEIKKVLGEDDIKVLEEIKNKYPKELIQDHGISFTFVDGMLIVMEFGRFDKLRIKKILEKHMDNEYYLCEMGAKCGKYKQRSSHVYTCRFEDVVVCNLENFDIDHIRVKDITNDDIIIEFLDDFGQPIGSRGLSQVIPKNLDNEENYIVLCDGKQTSLEEIYERYKEDRDDICEDITIIFKPSFLDITNITGTYGEITVEVLGKKLTLRKPIIEFDLCIKGKCDHYKIPVNIDYYISTPNDYKYYIEFKDVEFPVYKTDFVRYSVLPKIKNTCVKIVNENNKVVRDIVNQEVNKLIGIFIQNIHNSDELNKIVKDINELNKNVSRLYYDNLLSEYIDVKYIIRESVIEKIMNREISISEDIDKIMDTLNTLSDDELKRSMMNHLEYYIGNLIDKIISR